MSNLSAEAIRAAIADHPDPETGKPIDSMGQIKDIVVDGNQVTVTIGLSSHSSAIADEVADALESKIVATAPGSDVTIKIVDHERPPARVGQMALRAKSVIAVGSGKGGVGKSTVAASIALTLRRLGAKVGLMDADVYGPSIPHLLGLSGRPAITAAKRIEPIKLGGDMPVMSMGFLVEPDQAVIWRGPMLHGSINQFLGETEWGELDYLIIDMPPGTGDVALTLSQALPLAGAVVVCTPQEVALAGCDQGDQHVSQGQHSGAGNGREHERFSLSRLRQDLRHLWAWRRESQSGRTGRAILGRTADRHHAANRG